MTCYLVRVPKEMELADHGAKPLKPQATEKHSPHQHKYSPQVSSQKCAPGSHRPASSFPEISISPTTCSPPPCHCQLCAPLPFLHPPLLGPHSNRCTLRGWGQGRTENPVVLPMLSLKGQHTSRSTRPLKRGKTENLHAHTHACTRLRHRK